MIELYIEMLYYMSSLNFRFMQILSIVYWVLVYDTNEV